LDAKQQATGHVFPFSLWWRPDRHAKFDGQDQHPDMTDINSPWNTTVETVTEKDEPSLIGAVNKGQGRGIVVGPGHQ
jgi:hypothetical protein